MREGAGSVRPHMRQTGRTGSIHARQTPSSEPAGLDASTDVPALSALGYTVRR